MRTILRIPAVALGWAAAAMGVTTSAAAQSAVALYGRVDGAIYFQSRTHPGARQWTLSTDTSHFGLRGQEDLGGGRSALFKMEAQFDMGTGQTSSTAYFNRESYVGLSDKRWGTVLFGSMWGPSVWVSGKADAFGRAQLGALQTMIQGATNRGNTFQFNNAVQYISPRMGGLMARAYVQAAEGAATGRNHALGLEYTRGRLFLGLAYDNAQVTGTTLGLAEPVARTRTLGIGAAYDFGFIRLHGYVQRNRVRRLDDADSVNVSAAVPVSRGEFRVALGRWNRPNEAGARRFALGYAHFLSKRTQVYASLATLRNERRSTTLLFPISQDSPAAAAGQDVRAVGVGVRHTF